MKKYYQKHLPQRTGENCTACAKPLTTADSLHADAGLCTVCTARKRKEQKQ